VHRVSVGLCVDRHGRVAGVLARPHDADRDLATIRDEHLVHGRGLQRGVPARSGSDDGLGREVTRQPRGRLKTVGLSVQRARARVAAVARKAPLTVRGWCLAGLGRTETAVRAVAQVSKATPGHVFVPVR
jgi:hypothetical protein